MNFYYHRHDHTHRKPLLTWSTSRNKNDIFRSKEDTTFAEDRLDADTSLSNRENAGLLLNKRTCCSRSFFRTVEDWSDARASLK